MSPAKKTIALVLTGFTSGALALELPVAKPQTGTIHRWISLPASFAPWQQVALKARVAGYIKKITVDKGDAVTQGQKLIEIEVPELEADLIRHRAEVNVAGIGVRRLHEARVKSPDLVLPQAVDDAEARLAIAKAAMERATTLLEFAQINAPFAGTISARNVDPGAYSAAGGDTLLQLMDVNTLRLQVPVVEVETMFLKPGEQVEAKLDALGGAVVKGTISRISGALDPATRTMLIEVDFKNENGKLRPGMFATASVAVEQHDNALLIPVAGLVKEKVNSFVFKLVDGKAKKTAIKTGFNDGKNVEVLDGLRPEDQVLLVGAAAVTDGQPVTVKEAK